MQFPTPHRQKLHRAMAVLGQRTGPTTHQINAMNTMDRERIRGRIRPRPVWGENVNLDHESPEPANEMRRRNCMVNRLPRRGFVPGGGGCSCTSGASSGSDTPARRAECKHAMVREVNCEAARRRRAVVPRQEEVQQPGLRLRGGSLAPAVKLENQKRPATDTIRTCCELPVPSPRSDRSKRRICRSYGRSWVTAPLHSLTMMAGVFLVVALLGLPVPVVTPVLGQTPAPTTSSPPSLSAAPTVSLMPSAQPSVSLMPSAVPTVSLAPSAAPSISSRPSLSPTALDSDKDGIPDSSDQVSLLLLYVHIQKHIADGLCRSIHLIWRHLILFIHCSHFPPTPLSFSSVPLPRRTRRCLGMSHRYRRRWHRRLH